MYLPRHFEETRTEVLHGLIRERPFGALVVLTEQGLDVEHVPFLVDASPAPLGVLRAHVARANPVWQQARADVDALAIFQGPHGYITPSWYPSKQETGKVVPTWNYVVVHAHGALRFIEDRAWLRAHVEQQAARHEAARATPWRLSDAPADYVEKMLGAIVGLELTVTRVIGKWKVSQNRTEADREGVVAGLIAEGDEDAAAMARLMRGGG
jgi:transcriptional regulator